MEQLQLLNGSWGSKMNNNEVKENRCFYLEIDGSCQCYHTALSNLNQIYYCKDIINCYYKQLQACKEENEKLTQQNKQMKEALEKVKFEAEFNGNDESLQKIINIVDNTLKGGE